ncbi:amp dependent CoA ligase [Lactarius akahatsu]|uniref:Amp dependent CoA ligase n=1 Tax=Lactarius akahatsu TaxID=416441 RepID=A0AAD4QE33_9AGAM|nr:amp dependent CoA ligase [Lactarius akahatsu]
MTEFVSPGDPLPYIPDNLTLAQFVLDSTHPYRPLRPQGVPWLIEDATGRKIGLEEVRTRVLGLANALSLKWGIHYPTVMWATHRLGAIVTGANPSYTHEELTHQITTAKASILIAHPDSLKVALLAAHNAGIPPDRLITYGLAHQPYFVERALRPGEGRTKIAFLSFSSGTTGKPKAVEIPHYAPIANILQMAAWWRVNDNSIPWEDRRIRPGDITMAVHDILDIYGLVINSSVVVVPKFEFIAYLESIKRHKANHLLVVPPMIVLLCKHPATKNYDLSSIRMLFCGAAPLSAELTDSVVKLLPQAFVGQGYGMTETCTAISMAPLSQKVSTLGSAGQLISGTRVRVVKADGTLAKVGEPGELVVTGPSMALRYLNNGTATAETFVDGWVRTGDEAIIAENNDIFIVDRLKEILKVRGFQVAPAELEGHLLAHPDVADSCVVGVPDDFSGEVPLAFVVLSVEAAKKASGSEAAAAKIKASIVKHVADHKVAYKKLAGGVEFVDAIPKNPSGKLLRRVLRDKALNLKKSQAKVATTKTRL